MTYLLKKVQSKLPKSPNGESRQDIPEHDSKQII